LYKALVNINALIFLGLLNRTVGEELIEFIEPSQIRETKEENQLTTLIYS
jgi:hypothetical protein